MASNRIPFTRRTVLKGIGGSIGMAGIIPTTTTAQREPAFTVRLDATLDDIGEDITMSGSALGTHVGNATIAITHIIGNGDSLKRNGEYTITAANGDELTGTYIGSLSEDPVSDSDPPIHEFSAEYTHKGGTGRFAEARGSGTVTGIIEAQVGATLVLDGSIQF